MRIALILYGAAVAIWIIVASFQARPDQELLQELLLDAQKLKFEELGHFFEQNGFGTQQAIYYGKARYASGEALGI